MIVRLTLSIAFILCMSISFGESEKICLIKVLESLEMVESSGDSNAIGDKGKAVGVLQIHPIMVEEVNRINKQQGKSIVYTTIDRYSKSKSRAMAITYFSYWLKHYKIENPSLRDYCDLWNGGSASLGKRKGEKNKNNNYLLNLNTYYQKVKKEYFKRTKNVLK